MKIEDIKADSTDVWEKLLSANSNTGHSECCNAGVIVRMMDNKRWLECLCCGKECEINV